MRQKTKSSPFYELAFWLKDGGAGHDPNADFDHLKDLVARLGGEVTRSSFPRRRRLAYPIQKQTVGFFGYLHCILPSEKISALEEELKNTKQILRHLFIKRVEERSFMARTRTRPAPERAAGVASSSDSDEFEKKLAEILGS